MKKAKKKTREFLADCRIV